LNPYGKGSGDFHIRHWLASEGWISADSDVKYRKVTIKHKRRKDHG